MPEKETYGGVPTDPARLLVVLDIDETLVRAAYTKPPQYDFILLFGYEIYVTKRPGVEAFLESLTRWCDVAIFTAGEAEYARQIVEKIFPPRCLSSVRIFSRADCDKKADGAAKRYHKDLSRITDFNANRTVLVDDRHESFVHQPLNGIEVEPFRGSKEDTELFYLGAYLWMLNVSGADVQSMELRYWRDIAKTLLVGAIQELWINCSESFKAFFGTYFVLYTSYYVAHCRSTAPPNEGLASFRPLDTHTMTDIIAKINIEPP